MAPFRISALRVSRLRLLSNTGAILASKNKITVVIAKTSGTAKFGKPPAPRTAAAAQEPHAFAADSRRRDGSVDNHGRRGKISGITGIEFQVGRTEARARIGVAFPHPLPFIWRAGLASMAIDGLRHSRADPRVVPGAPPPLPQKGDEPG
jgi:hypothetical protein